MKKLLLVFTLLAIPRWCWANTDTQSNAQPTYLYNQPTKSNSFLNQVYDDTLEVIGKDLQASYFISAIESGDAKYKVGASAPLLAWKFITINPAIIYTPDGSHKVGEFGLAFPIRLGRIPIGNDEILENYIGKHLSEGDKSAGTSWIDRIFLAPYFSQSFTSGKFDFGANFGILLF